MIRVLFCCHGNICRSPMAESVFTHKVKALGLADKFLIHSMATGTEELGNPPHRGTNLMLCGLRSRHRRSVVHGQF